MRKITFLSITALCLTIHISPTLGAPGFDGHMRTKLDIMMQNLLDLTKQASVHYRHHTEMENLQSLVQQADGN